MPTYSSSLKDIELKSLVRDDQDILRRKAFFISLSTCICLIVFVTLVTYIAMWLFEYYNIDQSTTNSNSSINNHTIK